MNTINLLPISIVQAAEAEEPASFFGGGGIEQILLLVGFVAIFYFLIIRPQSKRNKQHKELIKNLAVGDEIITGGGFMGTVAKISGDTIDVSLADNITVKMQKSHVSATLPKGTIKSVK